jgi:hypothetical protein
MKTYAVTGEHHGSVIKAPSILMAILAFKDTYPKEIIMIIKDITNCNLENI